MHRVAAFCLAAACLVACGCAPPQPAAVADEIPAVPERDDGPTPVTDEPATDVVARLPFQQIL